MQCARCEKEIAPKPLKGQEVIVVRKEPITVYLEYYICSECGEEYLVPNPDRDPFKIAYEKYRDMNKMLQPVQIRSWREKHWLTQNELAKLLGLGGATISRYENGKLQDESHDKMLRLAMDPANLRKLVAESVDVFSEDKKKRVLEKIKKEATEELSLDKWIRISYSDYDADEYSGFKKFNLDKFNNAALYFCRGGVLKTKLNKLLFYADFKYFNEYTISITGARYARIPFGPAPDNYDLYYFALIKKGAIENEEIEYRDYSGEKMIAVKKPDLNLFSEGELRILSTIKEHFKNYNATDISSFSHGEKGYEDTPQGRLISYKYASQLRLGSQL